MPKYKGVKKTILVGEILARRWRGIRTERKSISSVTGPAM